MDKDPRDCLVHSRFDAVGRAGKHRDGDGDGARAHGDIPKVMRPRRRRDGKWEGEACNGGAASSGRAAAGSRVARSTACGGSERRCGGA